MVPRRGLEPPRPCERQHLKLVRLPIPPSGHGVGGRRYGVVAGLSTAIGVEKRSSVLLPCRIPLCPAGWLPTHGACAKGWRYAKRAGSALGAGCVEDLVEA